jgi:pyruvate-ferredoxin/flavodoxin oxidoreductase
VCPHAAIRSKVFPDALLTDAPATFKSSPVRSKDYPEGSSHELPGGAGGLHRLHPVRGHLPIRDKSNASHKALNMATQAPLRAPERENWAYFEQLPEYAAGGSQDQHDPRFHGAAAAFRVLRRLRGLR